MPDFEFSTHAKQMLRERKIVEQWVWRAIEIGKSKRGIYETKN
jgi:hypothetical protein